jgi:hypothetical protein
MADKSVTVKLPDMPVLGWRFLNNKFNMDLNISGEIDDIVRLSVLLYRNMGIHADQADKKAVFAKDLKLKTGKQSVMFTGVPFGVYTFRVETLDKRGEKKVIIEELVSFIHKTPKHVSADKMVWGVDSHADRYDRRVDIAIPSLKQLGANYARMEFLWADLVDKTGKPDFRHHDYEWKEGKKNGIKFFGLLNTTPQFATLAKNDGNNFFGYPPRLDEWEKWCRLVFRHFKNRIQYWEILNEPSGYAYWWFAQGTPRAEHHAKMMKIAAKVAKEISPDIKIMGPCPTEIGGAYLRQVIEAGAFDGIDVLSFHGMSSRSPKVLYKMWLRWLKEKYPERDFELWLSEGGYWGGFMISNMAEKNPVKQYDYADRDKGTNRDNHEDNYGLIKNCGTPKNDYIKHQYTVSCFGNARYYGRPFHADGVEAYLFEEKGKFTLGIWSEDKKISKFTLPSPGKKAKAFDSFGNPISSWSEGNTELQLESIFDPIVVTDIDTESPIVLDASVNCSADYEWLVAGKEYDLEFKFENPTSKPKQFALKLKQPNNWNFDKNELTVLLNPGQVKTKKIQAKIKANHPVEDVNIYGELTVDGTRIEKLFGPISVENPKLVGTVLIDDFERGLKWYVPKEQLDIHTYTMDEAGKRQKVDLSKNALQNNVSIVNAPASEKGKAGKFEYLWTRPNHGWGWVAKHYNLKESVPLKETATAFMMDAYMQNCASDYPIAVLLKFMDSTGQVFMIEGGGEIYWNGWQKWECTIPSSMGHAFIHSSYGPRGKNNMDIKFPLKFIGLILNQPPANVIEHFPETKPQSGGYLLLDNMRVKYYK